MYSQYRSLSQGWRDGYLRVNEVAALLIEEVEYLESSILATLAEDVVVDVAKVHSTQTYRADVYSGCRGEYPMTTEQALWRRRWIHCRVVCPVDG